MHLIEKITKTVEFVGPNKQSTETNRSPKIESFFWENDKGFYKEKINWSDKR